LAIVLIIFVMFVVPAQCWMLENPWNPIGQIFVGPVALIDSISIGVTGDRLSVGGHVIVRTGMIPRYEEWGDNFCAAGQIWLSSYEDVSKAVLEPQGRSARLGEHPLIASHFPMVADGGRDVFLLGLGNGDLGNGGPGDHLAFREAFMDTLVNHCGQDKREKDHVTEGLWKKLEEDYAKNLGDDAVVNSAFYNDNATGLYPFVSRYLHYVFLGIDPADAEIWSVLDNFYFGPGPMSYYLYPLGYGFASVATTIDEIIEIYVKSPVLKEFETKPAYHKMTKRELAGAATAILRLAGVTGTQSMAYSLLGVWGNPSWSDSNWKTFKKTDVWDKLDLHDTNEVDLYIMEVLRLNSAVTVSNQVATEDFSVTVGGSVRNFPKGTNVGIPLALGNTDKNFWGHDAHDFNMHRKGLMQNNVVWNGVGHREGNRRWCPGRERAMEIARGILVRLGKIRRKALGIS
jgi:hypothetical protein